MKLKSLPISVILIGYLFASNVSAQKYNEEIYGSYISGKMGNWENAMKEMESVWEVSGSKDILYDLVVAQYGYIAFLITVDRGKEARTFVKDTENKLEILLKHNKDWARAHALMGAIYGFKVKLNPMQAVIYGKRAFDENKLSFELAPDDPQVLMEKANIEFYKPKIFGSDPVEASKIYTLSIANYEKDQKSLKYNWMYLNTLISLADAYIESESPSKARDTYQKILRVEPNLVWIRDTVYPEFKKKYGF